MLPSAFLLFAFYFFFFFSPDWYNILSLGDVFSFFLLLVNKLVDSSGQSFAVLLSLLQWAERVHWMHFMCFLCESRGNGRQLSQRIRVREREREKWSETCTLSKTGQWLEANVRHCDGERESERGKRHEKERARKREREREALNSLERHSHTVLHVTRLLLCLSLALSLSLSSSCRTRALRTYTIDWLGIAFDCGVFFSSLSLSLSLHAVG